VTRPSHPGRGGTSPFGSAALDAAATATERTLTETCRIGTVTTTQDPNPPYATTTTFTADATGVACSVEPMDDRPVVVGDDPSRTSEFALRVPHGTPVVADWIVEVTAGRNTGLRLTVVEVHASSTEPLLRATCERITPGDA
jgi:hypothetical protein